MYFLVQLCYTVGIQDKEKLMNTNRLTTESVSKLFFRYLIPAIMGTMVTSIYILADTIIIGKGIGIHAMAALNIVLPLFNIFFGNGLLFHLLLLLS